MCPFKRVIYIFELRNQAPIRGRGGIGRRVRFRSVWGQPHGGSSPLARTIRNRKTRFGGSFCVLSICPLSSAVWLKAGSSSLRFGSDASNPVRVSAEPLSFVLHNGLDVSRPALRVARVPRAIQFGKACLPVPQEGRKMILTFTLARNGKMT